MWKVCGWEWRCVGLCQHPAQLIAVHSSSLRSPVRNRLYGLYGLHRVRRLHIPYTCYEMADDVILCCSACCCCCYCYCSRRC